MTVTTIEPDLGRAYRALGISWRGSWRALPNTGSTLAAPI
jgi:hypothetical protein